MAALLKIQNQCNIIQTAKTPSHTSLRRWINKVGFYKLTQPIEKADDWIYIIDCSVRMDYKKVFLILGIRSSQLQKGRYVTYEDLTVLDIRVIESNTDILSALKEAILRTGVPIQICSDTGGDLMPSIRRLIAEYLKIQHTPDIMHKTGNILKKKLVNDKRWNKFITLLNFAKKRLCLSELSFLCPPNIRGKSRFFNCQNVIDWANRILEEIEKFNKKDPLWKNIKKKLGWLKKFKKDLEIFTELFELAAISKEVVRKLHIDSQTWKAVEVLLEERIKSEEGRLYANEIVNFLKNECKKTSETGIFIGSSEIIESAFSKLKLLDRECGNSSFTESILGLVACFGKTDYNSLEPAFQKDNPEAIKEWSKKYIGETLIRKKKRILKIKRKKKLALDLTRFYQVKKQAA